MTRSTSQSPWRSTATPMANGSGSIAAPETMPVTSSGITRATAKRTTVAT
jgi:hypothetical protein